jgi:hypothetical protein
VIGDAIFNVLHILPETQGTRIYMVWGRRSQ